MDHLSNLPGFLVGLFFIIWFCWNVALGEIELRVGAIRFDEKPLIWTLFNNVFLTVGLLCWAQSICDIAVLDWLFQTLKTVSGQLGGSMFWTTYLLGLAITFALGKLTIQNVRRY